MLNNERAHDILDGVINNGVGGDEFCVNKLHSWIVEVDSCGEIILTEVLSLTTTQSTSLCISTTKNVDVTS